MWWTTSTRSTTSSRDFKGQHSMIFREEDWSKIKTLSLNSLPEFRNYIMKLIVWMIWEIKDPESVRSGLSHVPSQPALLPPFRDPGGMLRRSVGMPSRNDRPPDIWDTHGISGNVFVNPTASSSSPYPGGFSGTTEHTSPHVTSERQTPDTTLDPRCQSGPSARSSFDPNEGRSSKDWADQKRLQISELHFDKFPNPATFACWKIRFKTEVCTCSQFPTVAVLWIKEVELVESVDDLKSSRSIRGTQGPDFEVLDAKSASALNRTIQNTRFKKKSVWRKWKQKKKTASSEEDRSLTWSTSTSWSLEPMILSRSMPTYLQLFFEMMLFRNSIRNGTEFYCQWRKSHLMTSWKASTN